MRRGRGGTARGAAWGGGAMASRPECNNLL
jgi:hypothetical protein